MRCLETVRLTFEGLHLGRGAKESNEENVLFPFQPIVKEGFREGISAHTCDRRSSKSTIQTLFPSYIFEHGFSESDDLWQENQSETREAQDARTKEALDDVFMDLEEEEMVVSVTSHSGEIASVLRVLGHREFALGTGGVIPVVVRARVKNGYDAAPTSPAFAPVATCPVPPMTRDKSCNDCSCCK